MPEPLSVEEVRHVAALARLRPGDDEVEALRSQLSSIIEHVSRLERLDVAGVEPMAHPIEIADRLAEDEPGPALPRDEILARAPQVEGAFIAVPKVIQEGDGELTANGS